MKSATIKLALRAKVTEILDSVKCPETRMIMEQNILVCGGAIASMLGNEKVNDYDIYFKSYSAVLAVAKYYTKEFNETKGELKSPALSNCVPQVREETRRNIRGEEEQRVIIWIQSAGVVSEDQADYHYFESQPEASADDFVNSLGEAALEDPMKSAQDMAEDVKSNAKRGKFRPVFFTDNAVTLSDKVQMILRFHGDADQIHENYDYAHCMCAYDYLTNSLKLHAEALESILGKNLVYRGSLYPIASFFRTRKFLKRGWSITAGQMLKIVWQINELDLKDVKTLKEQLLGVDHAYMLQLISTLANREPHVKVDSTYIAKIIDEVFD